LLYGHTFWRKERCENLHGFPHSSCLPAFEYKLAAEDSLELFSGEKHSLCVSSEYKCIHSIHSILFHHEPGSELQVPEGGGQRAHQSQPTHSDLKVCTGHCFAVPAVRIEKKL